jgi:hypothetical protein
LESKQTIMSLAHRGNCNNCDQNCGGFASSLDDHPQNQQGEIQIVTLQTLCLFCEHPCGRHQATGTLLQQQHQQAVKAEIIDLASSDEEDQKTPAVAVVAGAANVVAKVASKRLKQEEETPEVATTRNETLLGNDGGEGCAAVVSPLPLCRTRNRRVKKEGDETIHHRAAAAPAAAPLLLVAPTASRRKNSKRKVQPPRMSTMMTSTRPKVNFDTLPPDDDYDDDADDKITTPEQSNAPAAAPLLLVVPTEPRRNTKRKARSTIRNVVKETVEHADARDNKLRSSKKKKVRATAVVAESNALKSDQIDGEANEVKLEGLSSANLIKFSKSKRQYGHKLLLGRHHEKGIARLGGGRQETFPKPRKKHPRLKDLGKFNCLCFNDLWQADAAPLYAGQLDACVNYVPEDNMKTKAEFALFMRRSLTGFGVDVKTAGLLLGWEYCGNYVYAGDVEIDSFWVRATGFSPVAKGLQAKKILKSSKSADGYGRLILDEWRARLTTELEQDPSPSGPQWMVERRLPTFDETKECTAPLAARARALDFTEDMSDKLLAELIVEIDEHHTLHPIRFVRYDETIYEYCKGGCTDKDANGKATNGPPATAQAWYAYLDTLIVA